MTNYAKLQKALSLVRRAAASLASRRINGFSAPVSDRIARCAATAQTHLEDALQVWIEEDEKLLRRKQENT
jgi:hypothetical protein